MRPTVVAIVLAGGIGSRFGGREPKQLARLAGHSVLYHSLRRLDESDEVDLIVTAGNPDWQSQIIDICDDAIRKKPSRFVKGGTSRNISVGNAVKSLKMSDAKILVHDSVRPLVGEELIKRVTARLDDVDAVLPVVPSADLLVEVNGGLAISFHDRSITLRGQSPQGFWLNSLRTVFEKANDSEATAVSTVFELLRAQNDAAVIATVQGDVSNIKITMPVDHMIAGRLLLDR